MAHAFSPRPWSEASGSEFKVNLVYKASPGQPRPGKTLVSKPNQTKPIKDSTTQNFLIHSSLTVSFKRPSVINAPGISCYMMLLTEIHLGPPKIQQRVEQSMWT